MVIEPPPAPVDCAPGSSALDLWPTTRSRTELTGSLGLTSTRTLMPPRKSTVITEVRICNGVLMARQLHGILRAIRW